MRATAGGGASSSDDVYSKVVDLYDSGTKQWSTAQLSRNRRELSATSVGAVAIFAGGTDGEFLRVVFVCCVRDC
jgi:hypothetical protein